MNRRKILVPVLAFCTTAVLLCLSVNAGDASVHPVFSSRTSLAERQISRAAVLPVSPSAGGDTLPQDEPAPPEETDAETADTAGASESADVSKAADTAVTPVAQEPVLAAPPAVPPQAEETTQSAPADVAVCVGIADGGVNLRSGPGTGYSALTVVPSGAAVYVSGGNENWVRVSYNGKRGYMAGEYVKRYTSQTDLNCYGWVDTDELNVRSGPAASYARQFSLTHGTYVTVTAFENGWFAITCSSGSGYVSGEYLALCASMPQSGGSSGSSSAGGSELGSSVVALARSFLGTPYVWGGASPSGFDCSGFIVYVFSQFGVSLPRGSNGQYYRGTPVSYSELQPGDLVFFYRAADDDDGTGITTHVGIYVGDGQFIHASSYYGGVVISSIRSGSSYYSTFKAGRRMG